MDPTLARRPQPRGNSPLVPCLAIRTGHAARLGRPDRGLSRQRGMTARFQIEPTPLPGVLRVQRMPITDDRGFLERLYCSDEFAEIGWRKPIAQINRTLTRKAGAVRGMHFQRP